MADDLEVKSFREVGIRLGSLNTLFADQIWWLKWALGGAFAVIIAIAGGGFTIYHEIAGVDAKVSSLDAKFAALDTSLKAAVARVDSLNSSMAALPAVQNKLEQVASRIEAASVPSRLSAATGGALIGLTADQYNGLRSIFNLKRESFKPTRYALGESVPADLLKDIPDIVFLKVAPSLKGAKFMIDPDGALIITAGRENRVALIVEPV